MLNTFCLVCVCAFFGRKNFGNICFLHDDVLFGGCLFRILQQRLEKLNCLKRSSMMCHVKNKCLRYDPEVPCG